jgi:hypothetical protein
VGDPSRVFLFSGHMIDAAGRAIPRFPADKEPIAATAIEVLLASLQAGADDLGLCSGACGGDILFAEAMLRRGARLEVRIPFSEGEFLEQSVVFEKSGSAAPDTWRDRFFAMKGNILTRLFVMPDELGPTPPDRNAF